MQESRDLMRRSSINYLDLAKRGSFVMKTEQRENFIVKKIIDNKKINERIATEVMENTVVMLNAEDIEIQNIDHLGIVAGIIDAIGLVETINELIGEQKGEKVSPGHVVKAMILNGLGFVSKPLYMFPKYFETIACEHLIGAGVKPEYLNDDKLGRTMDKLFIKGLDTIFFIIALKAAKKFGVSLSSSHLDSSSMHVHGQYNTSLPEVIFENKKVENNTIININITRIRIY